MSKKSSTPKKPQAPKAEKQATPVISSALTDRELRALLKGKPAAERNAIRRSNSLAVKAENKAKAVQA